MSEFTPGPWIQDRDAVVAGNDCVALCDTNLRDSAEHHANARLIAAAPDMLAAIKRLIDNMPRPDGHGCLAALVFAERVAAKAEGRSPEGIARRSV